MKGWRTLALNILLAIAPVIQATGAADLGLKGNNAEYYTMLVAVLNMAIRMITTTPVGKSE